MAHNLMELWSWEHETMDEQANDTIMANVYHIDGVIESHNIMTILPNDNKHIPQCPITVIM